MAAIAEFEQQDWVQQLTGGGKQNIGATKQHAGPNVAFPFDDDFSVGTIHGANAAKQPTPNAGAVVEIQNDEDDVSVLTPKTGADNQLEVVDAAPTPSSALPPLPPRPRPPAGDHRIPPAQVRQVRPPGGQWANSCQ